MKKKYIVLPLTLIVIFSTFVYFNYKKVVNVYENNSKNEEIVTKGLSMNLEQTARTGDYKQVTQSNWPTDGYIFNSELSRCENGSTLSWNDTKKTVVFSGNVSDKCYVYFDIWAPSIADIASQGDLLDEVIIDYGNKGPDVSKIYIHDDKLANGAGDNSYRYAGASEEVNNFMCFGSNVSPCSNDNLYRIIGVIGGRVKLIKYDYATSNLLGTDGDYYGSYGVAPSYYKGSLTSVSGYYWNYKATNSATNTWSTSLLNKTNLNTNFINNIGYEWANKIVTTTWKVGGNTESKIKSVVPSVIYQNEILSPDATNSTDNATEYNAKIGLMYVSDYKFATDYSLWTTYLDEDTVKNNWMYMGVGELTISRLSDSSISLVIVADEGPLINGFASTAMAVRPVFYLDVCVYRNGSGTMNDPIYCS